MTNMLCSDCGFEVTGVSPEKIAMGSGVRDPGEAVCRSCTSSRTRLVALVRDLPSDLRLIQSRRMASA